MKRRYEVLIIGLTLLTVILVFPYITVHHPHYSYCDEGMVSQEDFEKAHSQGGIRQGSPWNPAPTMLIYPDDPYIQQIASTIEGDTDTQKADAIITWIYTHIMYESDSVLYGCSEYWAVPSEILYYMKGDCEDFAILFCSIAKALDLDVVLFDYPEHTSAGLYADNGNLYHCNSMKGSLGVSLRFQDNGPRICEIGEWKAGWFDDYLIKVSRWERSLIDLPIGK